MRVTVYHVASNHVLALKGAVGLLIGLPFMALGGLAVIGAVGVALGFIRPDAAGPYIVTFIAGAGFLSMGSGCAWGGWNLLRRHPYEIRTCGDAPVDFVAVLRTTRIRVRDIRGIMRTLSRSSDDADDRSLSIRLMCGSVSVDFFPEIERFIDDLRAAKPSITVSGAWPPRVGTLSATCQSRVISNVHNNPREGVMRDRASFTRRLGAAFGGGSRPGLPRLLYAGVAVLFVFSLFQWIDSRPGSDLTMRLLTGSENRNLRPLIDRFAEQEGVRFEIDYQGSVDTMLDVQQGAEDYDAVWPASSIWLTIGDTGRIVEQTQSIMATPVVFAVKKPVAERLGWVGRDDVTVEEILAAAESGQIRYMTTSATQSNSGAMAFFGYLYAFAGQPDVLTQEMLYDPAVVEKTTRILNTVDRSAAASGFLADLFYQEYDAFDGMVNNESAMITTNQKLVADGKDPLYAIYPVGGLAIADWPLGFIDRGDEDKADVFAKFQAFLLSEEVQAELLKVGRRTGINLSPVGADPAVFNPDWGIDLSRVIEPITVPPPDVINEALILYQTEFRKPSFTVYCLDFSGSMEGDGERDLTSAMRIVLDPDQASRYFLQPSSRDITVVIPFNHVVIDQWRVAGNDPAALRDLLARVTEREAGGDTNIYDPVIAGLDAMAAVNIEDYSPAVILVTDGRSNSGSFEDLEARINTGPGADVPVYAILFGDASEDQLTEITDATTGRIFDGQADLIKAIRTAKGYN